MLSLSSCHKLLYQVNLDEIYYLHVCELFFFLNLAVTKGKDVEISMVKHLRTGLEDKYDIVEKWLLKDLEMIDGKEADTVSAVFLL